MSAHKINMLNVLIVTNDFQPLLGGVATFNQGIAESMALAGHQVTVLAPDIPGKNDANLTYRVIRYKKTKRLVHLWPNMLTFCLSIVNRFDVILYGHAVSTLSVGGILARKLNLARLAVLSHGNDLDYTVSCNLDKYFLDCLIKTADLILANSSYTKEVILNRYPKIDSRVKILNPGIWTDKICSSVKSVSNETENKIVILTAARLVPKKAVDDLINSFALMVNKYPHAVLKIVGNGPERGKLEELSQQLSLEKNIVFAGIKPSNEVYTEMKQCSIFVLPSKIVDGDVETFGIVYLEANACGKAVIGTNQGGVPDAVLDGVTGVLVEQGNIQQLATAMLTLIENKELRDKMGCAGRKRAEKSFDWAVVGKQLEIYLKEL